MDYNVLSWINEVLGNNKFVAVFARILSFIGDKWGMIAIVVLLLCFKKTRKIGFYVMVAGGLTWVINDLIIKLIVKRDRPFVTYPELENMCKLAGEKLPDGYSFASGHSATAMAVAVAIMFFSKKWGSVAASVAFLIGVSRLILCVHYPTDVIAGFAVGIVCSIALHYLTNLGFKIINSIRRNKNEKNSVSDKKSKQSEGV
ncbi:MAG: phosphatase PAP2 family protein [Clostridia bacterium]|nr:phosphatase PAP2 family protein [Clostridia bacterium]